MYFYIVHFRTSSEGSETKGDSRVSVTSQHFCAIVSNTLYLQVTSESYVWVCNKNYFVGCTGNIYSI